MNKTGFSYLEIIITMLILSVITAGSYTFHSVCKNFLSNVNIEVKKAEQATGISEKLNKYVKYDKTNNVMLDLSMRID